MTTTSVLDEKASILDEKQLGHLRHRDNLSRQLPHDWSSVQGKGAGEDDFGSYRFQLAFMIYGLALAHRHRLPRSPPAGHPGRGHDHH